MCELRIVASTSLETLQRLLAALKKGETEVLSEEDASWLAALLNVIEEELSRGPKITITLNTVEWLAKKLSALNEELSKVHAELQEVNAAYARVLEHYEA